MIVNLRVSKNGGRTWSDWKSADLGKTGSFGLRAVFRRLGRSRSFVFETRVTDPFPAHLITASIKAQQET